MGRLFANAGDALQLNESFNHSIGTICFTFKPTWSSPDGLTHHILQATGPNCILDFWKTSDGYFWCGINANLSTGDPIHETRILTLATPGFSPQSNLFNANEEAIWCFTWNDENFHDILFYKNGMDCNGLYGRPCWPGLGLEVPWTMPTFTQLTIGSNAALTSSANGIISEYARFDYLLSRTQHENMQLTGIAGVTPPPVHYVKILGDESPETAEIGSELIVVGSPVKAAHPAYRPLPPPMTEAKPPSTARIHWDHPLTDGLVLCWPFNEGIGYPREIVAGVGPSNVETMGADPGMQWEADRSFHMWLAALQYPTTVLDGLSSFTALIGMTIDIPYNGPGGFDFPNQGLPSMFCKQFSNGIMHGEDSQSVFCIQYQHGDEADIGSFGRDEFWATTGRGTGPPNPGGGFPEAEGIECWYDWRAAGKAWDSQYRQFFLSFDKDAPKFERWVLRYNGQFQWTSDVLRDVDIASPLPITSAPFSLGAGVVYDGLVGYPHKGRYQYLYIWNTLKPDVWQILLDDPFAFFRPAKIQTLNNVANKMTKAINGATIGLIKAKVGVV